MSIARAPSECFGIHFFACFFFVVEISAFVVWWTLIWTFGCVGLYACWLCRLVNTFLFIVGGVTYSHSSWLGVFHLVRYFVFERSWHKPSFALHDPTPPLGHDRQHHEQTSSHQCWGMREKTINGGGKNSLTLVTVRHHCDNFTLRRWIWASLSSSWSFCHDEGLAHWIAVDKSLASIPVRWG